MNNQEAIKVLKEFNKWRRGKGRKYSQPGFPFNPSVIGEAIDSAVKLLSYCLEPEHFIEVTEAASATEKRARRWAQMTRKSGADDKDTLNFLNRLDNRVLKLSPAVKAAKRICVRIRHAKMKEAK